MVFLTMVFAWTLHDVCRIFGFPQLLNPDPQRRCFKSYPSVRCNAASHTCRHRHMARNQTSRGVRVTSKTSSLRCVCLDDDDGHGCESGQLPETRKASRTTERSLPNSLQSQSSYPKPNIGTPRSDMYTCPLWRLAAFVFTAVLVFSVFVWSLRFGW